MWSRITEGDGAPDALTVEVARATAPQLMKRFADIVDDIGGQTRLHELRISERAGASPPDGTASIVVAYIGIAGFAEQTGAALRAFGTIATAGIIPAILLLPALAPWLATAACIAWGIRTIWRRRRRRAHA